ncbi:BTAD domain-containing putative transcriptional regulator [Actinosynnema sp. CS-041913]|uniref:AfsR/SARP family transcriptional regulator n=1 Tax=Actinosynnema sp. CS-041913 TaxID=3239917 RepID=UPI003D8E6DC8
MAVEFDVLGELVVRVDGRVVDLGPARRRCVLAALLLDANRTVSLDQVADRVWGESLPERVGNTLWSYLSRLRQVMGPAIERGPLGYRVVVQPGCLDLHRYRDAVAAGEHEKAFALWRGEPFAGLRTDWLDQVRESLLAEHFAARLDHFDVRIERGGHSGALAELRGLSEDHPLDERLHRQLILALYRSGRQAEALERYEVVRRRLADAVGADPSPALRAVHQDILAGAGAVPVTGSRPRQLPPEIRGFVGRVSTLDALGDALDGTGALVIDGAGGIGKTTLAVHWAHRVKHLFPDGQLYLNLHGFGPSAPVGAGDALESLLRGLGVPTDRIPPGVPERTALFRSVLDGQRVLLLLDNVKDSEQVRPLLPGNGSFVLATSRSRLRGLSVREGARLLTLDLLSPAEALVLLGSVIGAARVEDEREAAVELVELCARLPLAVRLAAEQAALHPAWPLRRLVDSIRRKPSRLEALSLDDDADTDLRALFRWSYESLEPEAARMFALLGLFPGNDISVPAAAALAGVDGTRAGTALGRLVTASMLGRRDDDRYEPHDLIREFAQGIARDAEEERTARDRLVGWYVHTAVNGRHVLTSEPHELPVEPLPESVTALEFTDRRTAMAWYDAERDTLLELVLNAEQHGGKRTGILIAQLCWNYFHLRGGYTHLMAAYEASLGYAVELGDEYLEARCCNGLTLPYEKLGRTEDDLAAGVRALRIFEKLGDDNQQATSLLNLSSIYNSAGRHRDAYDATVRARSLALAGEDAVLAAMALNNHANSLVGLGRFPEALTAARQAAAEFRATGELSRLIAGLDTIANVHAASGDHRAAVEAGRDALKVAEEVDATARESALRVRLGHRLVAAGERSQAIDVWRRAHELAIQRQDPAAHEIEALLSHMT